MALQPMLPGLDQPSFSTSPPEMVARRMIEDLHAWQRGEVAWSEVERSVTFHD